MSGKYEVVEGVCSGVSTKIVGKFKTVRITDDAGAETSIRLAKNHKLLIGERYRLYFDKKNEYRTGSGFLDTALATNGFLGYEAIPEIKNDSED